MMTSPGFVLRTLNDVGMLSVTCDVTQLPRDARNVFSINLEHRPTGHVGSSDVIAALSNVGE